MCVCVLLQLWQVVGCNFNIAKTMETTTTTTKKQRDVREDLEYLAGLDDDVVQEVLSMIRHRRGLNFKTPQPRRPRRIYSIDDEREVPSYLIEITTDTTTRDHRGLVPKYLHNDTLKEDFLEEYCLVTSDVSPRSTSILNFEATEFNMEDDDDDDEASITSDLSHVMAANSAMRCGDAHHLLASAGTGPLCFASWMDAWETNDDTQPAHTAAPQVAPSHSTPTTTTTTTPAIVKSFVSSRRSVYSPSFFDEPEQDRVVQEEDELVEPNVVAHFGKDHRGRMRTTPPRGLPDLQELRRRMQSSHQAKANPSQPTKPGNPARNNPPPPKKAPLSPPPPSVKRNRSKPAQAKPKTVQKAPSPQRTINSKGQAKTEPPTEVTVGRGPTTSTKGKNVAPAVTYRFMAEKAKSRPSNHNNHVMVLPNEHQWGSVKNRIPASTRGIETQLSCWVGPGGGMRSNGSRQQQQQQQQDVLLLTSHPDKEGKMVQAELGAAVFAPAFEESSLAATTESSLLDASYLTDYDDYYYHYDNDDDTCTTMSSVNHANHHNKPQISDMLSTNTSIDDVWLARVVLNRYARSNGTTLDQLVEDVCDHMDRIDQEVFSVEA